MKWMGMSVILVTVWCRPGAASAEPGSDSAVCNATPSPSAVQEAKNSFHLGEKAFQEAAYAHAIELWSTAYKNDCTAHALLLNLATAQELHHKPQQAVHSLRLFNRRKPQSPYVEPNFKRIIRLEDQINQRTQEFEKAEKRRIEAAQEGLRARKACEVPVANTPRLIPTALMSGGFLTALAGVGIFFEAQAAEAEAQEACDGDRTRCENFEAVLSGESARSRVGLGTALGAGGVALASVGLLWHWLGSGAQSPAEDEQSRNAADLQWLAVGTDRGLGLQLSGKF